MSGSFKRLTLRDREELAIYRAEGKSIRQIAKIMGFSHSSLSRELKRLEKAFGWEVKYSPCVSEDVAKRVRRRSGRKKSLEDLVLREYVESRIKLGWSPELISGRMAIDYPDQKISYETIYQHVYSQIDLLGYLPRRHAFRKNKTQYRRPKKSLIPNRLSIEHRPEVINERKEFGHWESDSVVSGKSKASLNVMVERLSRYVQITPLKDGTAKESSEAIILRLSGYNETCRQSITYDNGTENTQHEAINEKLKLQSYFCNPYSSWEKGSVENMNGLIRRYIPKKMDIAKVTEEQIKQIEHQLNNRPKKCLGFLTPAEVFNSFLQLVQ